MYQKGDKIVYPLYGAGIIEDIETKEIDGEESVYYVLQIPIGNLKIMISAAKAESLCVRLIHNADDVMAQLYESFKVKPAAHENWNLRYKENMERIRSGKIAQVASVFNSLMLRERERGLSTAEKKMMTTAKQIILSELMLSLEISKNEAEDILARMFK